MPRFASGRPAHTPSLLAGAQRECTLGAYRATVRLANTLSLGVALVGEPRSSPVERVLYAVLRALAHAATARSNAAGHQNLLDLLSQRIKHG